MNLPTLPIESNEENDIEEAAVEIQPDIRVLVQRDRLAAMMDVVIPPGAPLVTKEQLLKVLEDSGVVHGIDHQALEWVVKARCVKNVLCAKGTEPCHGEKAFLKYHVDIENQGRPTALEDGSVDFKNINSFLNVEKEQLLVEKIPPTLGIPGKDVLGLPVPAKPGKDISMPTGKNTSVVDGCRLVAEIDGQFNIVGSRINVLPTIEINGDIDYSTGNIDFSGNVIIHGSVQTGFFVKADGNVEIRGAICGAVVEASNILVRMGIQGMGIGVVKAKNQVVAKFVENATVYASQEVLVSNVVLHSSIYAGVKVSIEGKRGCVVGGRISAGEEIHVRTAGNRAEVQTELEVSVNPLLRDEMCQLQSENCKNYILLAELKQALAYLNQQGIENLNVEKRERYEQMTLEYNALPERIEYIEQRLIDIKKLLFSLKDGIIRVSDILYPGVKVSIGPLTKAMNDSLKYLSLYVNDGEIKLSSFK